VWVTSGYRFSIPETKPRNESIQAAEDAGVVAADIEDFVPLQVEVTVDGIDQHLWWGNQDIEGIFEQGDCWMQFNFNKRIWVALEI